LANENSQGNPSRERTRHRRFQKDEEEMHKKRDKSKYEKTKVSHIQTQLPSLNTKDMYV